MLHMRSMLCGYVLKLWVTWVKTGSAWQQAVSWEGVYICALAGSLLETWLWGDGNEVPGSCSRAVCSLTSPCCCFHVPIHIFCMNQKKLDFLSALSLEELINQLWLEKIALMVRVYWKEPWRAPTLFCLMKCWLYEARGWFVSWGLCIFDFFTSYTEGLTKMLANGS